MTPDDVALLVADEARGSAKQPRLADVVRIKTRSRSEGER